MKKNSEISIFDLSLSKWVKKLRVWTWYGVVHLKVDLSDHQLDKKFCILASQKDLADDPTGDKDGERPRVFEGIGLNKVIPAEYGEGDVPWLVVEVAKDPAYRGTADVFTSRFWVIYANPTDLQGTHDLVEDFLQEFGFERVELMSNEKWLEYSTKHSPLAAHNRCLETFLNRINALDQLYILTLLVWEADMAGLPILSESLRGFLDEHLDTYFVHIFGHDPGTEIYLRVFNDLTNRNREVPPDQYDLRAGLETRVDWIIVPKKK